MIEIEYIPKEFHDVKMGVHENNENECTPYFPDSYIKVSNQIAVSVPRKIICKNVDSCPVIPLCGVYRFPERRGLKYANLLTAVIHIRKIQEVTWNSGEIMDKNSRSDSSDPFSPNYDKEYATKKQQEIANAQKYSDDELEEDGGRFYVGVFNVNIVEYVNIPFGEGIYEVFVSKSGLESNRTRVEIVFEK